MIKLELTKEEAEVLRDYTERKCIKLEDAGLKDSKCYPILYKITLELQKQIKEEKPEMPKFEMTYVGNRSSNVESVGWLDESLYVKFQHNQTLYRYDGVPRQVYEEALSADSVGRYIVGNVKDKYPVVKVN